MIRARCKDPGDTTQLFKGDLYYLFENGPGKYYASRFENKHSHFGCFDAKHFEVQQPAEPEEWPPEPERIIPQLEPGKVYLAKLIWRKPGYEGKGLHMYFIKPKTDHAYFYFDEHLQHCGGCFPLHWFEIRGEAEAAEALPEPEVFAELEPEDWEQMSLF